MGSGVWGTRGRLIGVLGGGGCVGVGRLETILIQVDLLIYKHCTVAVIHREYIMYTVSITWGDTVIKHTAITLSSAKQWLYQYPNKDLFGKVTDLFGRTVAVRYCR